MKLAPSSAVTTIQGQIYIFPLFSITLTFAFASSYLPVLAAPVPYPFSLYPLPLSLFLKKKQATHPVPFPLFRPCASDGRWLLSSKKLREGCSVTPPSSLLRLPYLLTLKPSFSRSPGVRPLIANRRGQKLLKLVGGQQQNGESA